MINYEMQFYIIEHIKFPGGILKLSNYKMVYIDVDGILDRYFFLNKKLDFYLICGVEKEEGIIKFVLNYIVIVIFLLFLCRNINYFLIE
jgi:hypothetical protein